MCCTSLLCQLPDKFGGATSLMWLLQPHGCVLTCLSSVAQEQALSLRSSPCKLDVALSDVASTMSGPPVGLTLP